jgi:hypothetical protein
MGRRAFTAEQITLSKLRGRRRSLGAFSYAVYLCLREGLASLADSNPRSTA